MNTEFKCDCCGAVNEITVVQRKDAYSDRLKAAWLRATAVPDDGYAHALKYDDREEFWKDRLLLTDQELSKINNTSRFLWWVSVEYADDEILHGLVNVLPPYQFKVIRSWKVIWP